jgi:hypothetical protein
MAGKIGGQYSQIFQPAPKVSSTVYGAPTDTPGFAPFPAAPTKRSNGQVSYELPPTGIGEVLPELTAINPASQSQVVTGRWDVVVTGTCDPLIAMLYLIAPDGTEWNSHEMKDVTATTFTVTFTDAPTNSEVLGPGGRAELRQAGGVHGSVPWEWLP